METLSNKNHGTAMIRSRGSRNPGYTVFHRTARSCPGLGTKPPSPPPRLSPRIGPVFFVAGFCRRCSCDLCPGCLGDQRRDFAVSTKSGRSPAAKARNSLRVVSGSGPPWQALELSAPQPPGAHREGRTPRDSIGSHHRNFRSRLAPRRPFFVGRPCRCLLLNCFRHGSK